jgi:hypothetical protein
MGQIEMKLIIWQVLKVWTLQESLQVHYHTDLTSSTKTRAINKIKTTTPQEFSLLTKPIRTKLLVQELTTIIYPKQ